MLIQVAASVATGGKAMDTHPYLTVQGKESIDTI
jgi:hypothetical protein